ncbi:MAG: diheme cytochrome c [Magnetococcales bacterium]|nr:diheme cytochrome c [Magnetococcales bacterium]
MNFSLSSPVAALLGVLLLAGTAHADGDDRTPPIQHPETLKECGGCHMAYPPQMLPARSWEKLMGGLKEHFGENAQLDDGVRQSITTYLIANAGDAGGRSWKFLRGVGADQTPLRLSETPRWKREHDKPAIRQGLNDPKVGSAANCPACHAAAAKGDWELD